ncbi:hypothetical protein [Microbacterium jejuense]|uniref:hypothetical protein n=1 Tax=Microbacterium jejuense TaxID=1263637 RepID=UPI0031F077CD
MNDVIPIRPPVTVPTFTRDSITDLLKSGRIPEPGDFIRSISLQDDNDEGAVLVSTPMFGRVRDVDTHLESEHPSVTFRFDFGLAITLTGQATITWREQGETA